MTLAWLDGKSNRFFGIFPNSLPKERKESELKVWHFIQSSFSYSFTPLPEPLNLIREESVKKKDKDG